MMENEALNILLRRGWTVQVSTEVGETRDCHCLRLVPPPGSPFKGAGTYIDHLSQAWDPEALARVTHDTWESINAQALAQRAEADRWHKMAKYALDL